MIVHLIDGTYELFRHFYGLRSFSKGKDKPMGAVAGVLNGVLQMIDEGATHLGVATDHVIESFRNDLWDGYKTGEGIEPALWKQFHPLEKALETMGVVVWPMVELEADDALASAAHLASKDKKVDKVCIWTPDKDLAQCVLDDRVVQIDRRAKVIRPIAKIASHTGTAGYCSPTHPGVTLTAQTASDFTYIWLENGAPTSGTGTSYLATAPGGSAAYNVRVTDGYGCTATSSPVIATRNLAPTAAVFSGDQTICPGETAKSESEYHGR